MCKLSDRVGRHVLPLTLGVRKVVYHCIMQGLSHKRYVSKGPRVKWKSKLIIFRLNFQYWIYVPVVPSAWETRLGSDMGLWEYVKLTVVA